MSPTTPVKGSRQRPWRAARDAVAASPPPAGSGVAADQDGGSSRAGGRVGIVAHGQRRELEPERAAHCGVAGPKRVGGSEPTVAAYVLVDAVGRVGRAESDPQANQSPTGGQV